MPMRLLWSLTRAAPALLRHLAGYAELVSEDLAQMQRDLGARFVAAAILGMSAFFVILSGCLLILALTWDTPHRVAAIVWMGAAFLVVAVVAAVIHSNMRAAQAPFLQSVRREWQEDRLILEQLLSSDE
jgi:uncharacterized membrane protein YqjE